MTLADRYTEWRGGGLVLHEDAPLRVARKVPEIEIQARWFAEELGREFSTTSGDSVSILEFGVWNSELGPHFTKALVSFRGESPVRGGIHVTTGSSPMDAISAGRDNTVLHVFASGGPADDFSTAREQRTPQVRLDISRFEFAQTDPDPDQPDRCGAPLATLPLDRMTALLEAAAQFRLCRKAARLRRQSAPEEGLYQGVAETLGYRHNKLPFTLLAQRFPLSRIRAEASCEAECFLFGGAGFLTATDLGTLSGDTRGYLRELWGQWWPRRAECERLSLPSTLWTLRGVRPVNHPQRRVAALAEIVRNWMVIQTLARQCDVTAIRGFFSLLTHPYWDRHYTLTSQRSATRMALVGETRVTEMLANVFFPMAVSGEPRLWNAYRELPALDSNQRVDRAAGRLFGPAPALRKLLKLAVYQQGLLQLYEDHCMSRDGDCTRCELRSKLERWNEV